MTVHIQVITFMWHFTGKFRPSFAIVPRDSEESVWDYPRPPVCQAEKREVIIRFQDLEIARSCHALRVLETASPPTVYIPPADVKLDLFTPTSSQSHCEWKGTATYWSLKSNDTEVRHCAWSYENPNVEYSSLAGFIAVYPSRLECWLGGERVKPQTGNFYGGWVTSEIIGPWKGQSGTGGW